MTYGDLIKLEKQSKHPKIASVVFLYSHDKKKFVEIKVYYKSGKTYRYNKREQIPESVMQFLREQNKHFVFKWSHVSQVWYFMI